MPTNIYIFFIPQKEDKVNGIWGLCFEINGWKMEKDFPGNKKPGKEGYYQGDYWRKIIIVRRLHNRRRFKPMVPPEFQKKEVSDPHKKRVTTRRSNDKGISIIIREGTYFF